MDNGHDCAGVRTYSYDKMAIEALREERASRKIPGYTLIASECEPMTDNHIYDKYWKNPEYIFINNKNTGTHDVYKKK